MAADFFNIAAIEHDDLVGRQNGGEPVRDRDYRAAGGKFLERLLDLFFRFGVERRCRFIEQ